MFPSLGVAIVDHENDSIKQVQSGCWSLGETSLSNGAARVRLNQIVCWPGWLGDGGRNGLPPLPASLLPSWRAPELAKCTFMLPLK